MKGDSVKEHAAQGAENSKALGRVEASQSFKKRPPFAKKYGKHKKKKSHQEENVDAIKVSSKDLPGSFVAEYPWQFLKVVVRREEELEREMAVLKVSDASSPYAMIDVLKAILADRDQKLKELEGLPSITE